MKAPVKALYEELKVDKNITSSQTFIPGVESYRPITWNDALHGNQMTEDEGFIGGAYATFDPNENINLSKKELPYLIMRLSEMQNRVLLSYLSLAA